jgi:hypothetical protein
MNDCSTARWTEKQGADLARLMSVVLRGRALFGLDGKTLALQHSAGKEPNITVGRTHQRITTFRQGFSPTIDTHPQHQETCHSNRRSTYLAALALHNTIPNRPPKQDTKRTYRQFPLSVAYQHIAFIYLPACR